MIVMTTMAYAGNADKINDLSQQYINRRAQFYPVWATSIGIFDYDSLYTDYSAESVFKYRNDISIYIHELARIDTTSLKPDQLIDYKLLKSDIEKDEFFLATFPLYERSAALYMQEPLDGIYYLLIDKTRTIKEKAPFLMERIRKVGDFIEQRWPYQYQFAPIYYRSAKEMVDGGISLVEQASKLVIDAVSEDSARYMARYMQNAIGDMQSFKTFCDIENADISGTNVIGKSHLNYLLQHVYFLDVDSDSLKKIGWSWYNISNAKMDSLQKLIDAQPKSENTNSDINWKLTKDDILNYYQDEINATAKFFKDNNIVTIPDYIGPCVPVEMPEFMRALHKGIAYQPPAPFSSDQTGYFYVRPISELDSAAVIKYSNMIDNHGFKGSCVHEGIPGHHLQLSIANHNKSNLRKIQDNTMMAEGWALYCEQMAMEQGLYNGDKDILQRWNGVWGGIRFRAVRVIVDCSLGEGSMTPDSALTFMNAMLGDHTDYYTAEIRRYCENPTVALSYLTGKLIILDMLDKARQKEGKSFSLKKFHDSILAEGTIPPILIAQKLGYK